MRSSTTVVDREIEAAIPDSDQKNRSADNLETGASTPGHQEIERLAYRYWQERGCPEGCAEDDWFRAERELAADTRRNHGVETDA